MYCKARHATASASYIQRYSSGVSMNFPTAFRISSGSECEGKMGNHLLELLEKCNSICKGWNEGEKGGTSNPEERVWNKDEQFFRTKKEKEWEKRWKLIHGREQKSRKLGGDANEVWGGRGGSYISAVPSVYFNVNQRTRRFVKNGIWGIGAWTGIQVALSRRGIFFIFRDFISVSSLIVHIMHFWLGAHSPYWFIETVFLGEKTERRRVFNTSNFR